MYKHMLKTAALLAAGLAGGACGPPGEIGPGGGPSDTSNGDPREASPSDPGGNEPTEMGAPTSPDGGTNNDLPGVGDESGRPWAHNTGPTDPGALVPSGSTTITTDGAILEDLDVSGAITIDANDVTIRNFRIAATSHYGIKVESGHSGIVIEDGEIYGMSSAAILGVGFTARRLHIHDSSGDGIKAQGSGGPTFVEYCFIEKLGKGDGAHADGNQTRGGSNITFRYNNIYMPVAGSANYPGNPYKSNATFILQLEISNFVIENNWLNGGNYTVYCHRGATVRNNLFGRDYRYGTRSATCGEWSGNRWEDTGQPL